MAENRKDDKKPEAEAAELKMVTEMPEMPQAPALRMLVIETNGARAEVRACTMQAQEALHILGEVATLIRQGVQNSPPLHPAPLKVQAPPPAEAEA